MRPMVLPHYGPTGKRQSETSAKQLHGYCTTILSRTVRIEVQIYCAQIWAGLRELLPTTLPFFLCSFSLLIFDTFFLVARPVIMAFLTPQPPSVLPFLAVTMIIAHVSAVRIHIGWY